MSVIFGSGLAWVINGPNGPMFDWNFVKHHNTQVPEKKWLKLPNISPNHKITEIYAQCSSDGRYAVYNSGGPDYSQIGVVYELRTGQVRKLIGHTLPITAMAISPDSRFIATSSEDATCRIWDPVTGQSLLVLHGNLSKAVRDVQFNSDGTQIAAGSDDGNVRIWDIGRENRIAVLPLHEYMDAAQFTQDDHTVMAYTRTGLIGTGDERAFQYIWDLKSDNITSRVPRALQPVELAQYNKMGTLDNVGIEEGLHSLDIRDKRTGKMRITIPLDTRTHLGDYRSSPDGQYLVVCSEAFPDDMRENISIWNVTTGQFIANLQGHTDNPKIECFSSDAKLVVTSCPGETSKDHSARIWEVQTGRLFAVLNGHGAGVNCACFSPTGNQVVTGSHDGTVRVWDARNGICNSVLQEVSSSIVSVAFNQEGKRLITASTDGTVRVYPWEMIAPVQDLLAMAHARIVTSNRPLSPGELKHYIKNE